MGNQFGAKAMLRSALLMTGSTYVAYAAGLITSMLIARGLGPADYGRYAYLIWLSGVLVLLMNHGLTTSAIRFISESLGRQDSHGARSLHRWFQTRQGWSVVVVGALFLLALPLLKPSGWEGDLLIFAGSRCSRRWPRRGTSSASRWPRATATSASRPAPSAC